VILHSDAALERHFVFYGRHSVDLKVKLEIFADDQRLLVVRLRCALYDTHTLLIGS